MAERSAFLIMLQGHQPGSKFRLRRDHVTTIGRSSQNDVSLVSPTVSRFHCEVTFGDGQWQIADLNSKKGTIVNGRRIEGAHGLTPGDIIRLSTNVFRFDMLDESDRTDEVLIALKAATLDADIAPKGGPSEASLQAIRDRGRIDLREKGAERRAPLHRAGRLLPNIVFVLIGSILVLICTAAVYGVRLQRVRQLDEAAQVRADRSAEELRALKQAMGEPGFDARKGLDAAASIAKRYGGTSASEEIAASVLPELKRRVSEDQWAEADIVLKRVLEYERVCNFKPALDLVRFCAGEALDPALRRFFEQLEQRIVGMAETAYAERKAAAEEALRENDRESAILHYMEVIEQFGITEYVRQAQAAIAKIQTR